MIIVAEKLAALVDMRQSIAMGRRGRERGEEAFLDDHRNIQREHAEDDQRLQRIEGRERSSAQETLDKRNKGLLCCR